MATSRRRSALVDTSVAVALVIEDHVAHEDVLRELDGWRLGLSGHAWFETYSVLTRIAPPARRRPAEVTRILGHNFPASRFLAEEDATSLARKLAGAGVAGGSVYDALVGAAAAVHGLPLLTRDERAASTYRALDVDFRLVG